MGSETGAQLVVQGFGDFGLIQGLEDSSFFPLQDIPWQRNVPLRTCSLDELLVALFWLRTICQVLCSGPIHASIFLFSQHTFFCRQSMNFNENFNKSEALYQICFAGCLLCPMRGLGRKYMDRFVFTILQSLRHIVNLIHQCCLYGQCFYIIYNIIVSILQEVCFCRQFSNLP